MTSVRQPFLNEFICFSTCRGAYAFPAFELGIFSAQFTSITGTIPKDIGGLAKLCEFGIIIRVEDCVKSLSVSDFSMLSFALSLLKQGSLVLDTNDLTGTVPTEFANLSSLGEHLSKCTSLLTTSLET